jgi:hypothetical protein
MTESSIESARSYGPVAAPSRQHDQRDQSNHDGDQTLGSAVRLECGHRSSIANAPAAISRQPR